MPVTDGVVYMKFTYDLFNDATDPPSPAISCENPGAAGDVCVAGTSTGLSPIDITKINVLHMAMDSALKGVVGYQGLQPGNLVTRKISTYNNQYPLHWLPG